MLRLVNLGLETSEFIYFEGSKCFPKEKQTRGHRSMNLQLILYNDITIIHSLASIRQIVVKFLIGVETLQLFDYP